MAAALMKEGSALTDAGDGPIRRLVHVSPASFYAELVALGGETPEQVLNAARLLGTTPERIVDKTVPGGHIGLFMGARTLAEHWPELARWIVAQSA